MRVVWRLQRVCSEFVEVGDRVVPAIVKTASPATHSQHRSHPEAKEKTHSGPTTLIQLPFHTAH